MPVLQPNEYDASYFDGGKQVYTHNAGYTSYERWKRFDLGSDENPKESLGEYWLDLASEYVNVNNLKTKKVLEIGCAKGFMVEAMRDLGVEAYGIDVSEYAIGEAREDIKQYLTVADARTALSQFKRNEFDAVFSCRFLECIAEEDLPDLISEINRISKYQFHVIDPRLNPDYYNNKTIEAWAAMAFDNGTIIISNEKPDQRIIV